MPVTTFAVPTTIPGELVLANASQWYQLSSISRQCTRVRLSAPTAASPKASLNVNSILVCESSAMPTTTAGAWELPASATGLNYVLVSDAKMVWLYALNAGDAVEYSIQ